MLTLLCLGDYGHFACRARQFHTLNLHCNKQYNVLEAELYRQLQTPFCNWLWIGRRVQYLAGAVFASLLPSNITINVAFVLMPA
jgi:hypothetical protein